MLQAHYDRLRWTSTSCPSSCRSHASEHASGQEATNAQGGDADQTQALSNRRRQAGLRNAWHGGQRGQAVGIHGYGSERASERSVLTCLLACLLACLLTKKDLLAASRGGGAVCRSVRPGRMNKLLLGPFGHGARGGRANWKREGERGNEGTSLGGPAKEPLPSLLSEPQPQPQPQQEQNPTEEEQECWYGTSKEQE